MWKWEAHDQGRAVAVIVHSAYEHHRRYAWLIERLRANHCHVVMGDLPGHGEGAKLAGVHDERFEEYHDYVTKLTQVAMEDNLPIFIIGHGMGATLVIQQLQSKSIVCAGVILTSPWFHLQIGVSKFSNALSSISVISDSVKKKHAISLKQLTRNYDVYMEEKDDPYFHTTITLNWYHELQSIMKTNFSAIESIPNIPLLVMTGQRDKVTDIRDTKQWVHKQDLSEFQYKEWQHCFHDLFHEPEREEVFLFIKAFMSNVLRSIGYIVE
ncbi:alpha/beta hydrolase [Paenisporosarcina cavernae]|uniref:Alpha/beta hydrolase n=1 Tax=Paenisporosarcina cavernae TaxID=2320858 RepID=A0A385YSX6_9BACL|nr:alpha/beta hydrolase [Paenisporosarcina cavernae]AYC29909.1 alpha/beta hydrolase [Paenisporosarcina cavernae]